MSLPRLLTIMGSGETAPTMTKTHREIAAQLPQGSHALLLDTPYGFQENASELASKTVEYFRTSINMDLKVAGLQRIDNMDPLDFERAMNAIDSAQYVFAGPGSPTFALRQWASTPIAGMMVAKLREGGCVTFASAAALTLGRKTVPVYEIYKAGHDPYWLDGLNILDEIGLPVVVIPHYDNAEGGHHDTRFCYLGERRLSAMEAELPDEVFVLGVDEHTAVVFDLDADTATVTGKGNLTIRRRGHNTVINSGSTVSIDAIRQGITASTSPVTKQTVAPTSTSQTAEDVSLAGLTTKCESDFDSAIETSDIDSALRAIFALESGIRAWSADTLQSDENDRAHATLRRMIGRIGDFAKKGIVDPRDVHAPLVEVVLRVRSAAREKKIFELTDLIRDEMSRVGFEIRDTPAGPEWVLHETKS